jgi:acyl carrier protein
MAATVTEQIKRLIVEELDVPTPPGFDETTPLFKGGVEMDSFAVVELLALIESHFEIEFELADITPEHFSDVNTLGTLVAKYL